MPGEHVGGPVDDGDDMEDAWWFQPQERRIPQEPTPEVSCSSITSTISTGR